MNVVTPSTEKDFIDQIVALRLGGFRQTGEEPPGPNGRGWILMSHGRQKDQDIRVMRPPSV